MKPYQEVVDELSHFPEHIAQVSSLLNERGLAFQPSEEDWSVYMVVAHLKNCERFFYQRILRISQEENPTVMGFGPEDAPPFSDLPFSAVVDEFRLARQQVVDLLRDLTEADLQRPANHEVTGQTSIPSEAQRFSDHDAEHLQQIHDLVAKWQILEQE
ncbi:MAG: DinB family protein [Phototrophicaceae bacterium]